LTTIDGINYTMTNGWELITNSDINGAMNINGLILLTAATNISDLNLTGDLHINTGADSTITFSNVQISGKVYNDDSSHNLIINTINNTNIVVDNPGNGTGQVDIHEVVNFKFTLSPSITGYEWRLYEVNNKGSLDGAINLAGEESATADNQTYQYNYTQDKVMAVQILPHNQEDFVESDTYYTLSDSNKSVTITLEKDINN